MKLQCTSMYAEFNYLTKDKLYEGQIIRHHEYKDHFVFVTEDDNGRWKEFDINWFSSPKLRNREDSYED